MADGQTLLQKLAERKVKAPSKPKKAKTAKESKKG
jgi:hypothetical protein